MPNPTRFSAIPIFLLLGSAATFVLSGCSSDSPSDRPDPALMVHDYPPAMSGEDNFAEGKLTVQVTLGLPGAYRSDGKDPDNSSSSHGHRGGGGGGHHRGGGMGGGSSSAPDSTGGGTGDQTPRPSMMGSNLPPAQLKLHLKNNSGADLIDCEVVDFKSSLGDFAVFPSKYQVSAGQTVDSETMTSRLGVEGAEIPVTVALRIKGHVETKVITLHQLAPPPAPAPDTTPVAPSK
jgi:hypothetical protein